MIQMFLSERLNSLIMYFYIPQVRAPSLLGPSLYICPLLWLLTRHNGLTLSA